jgi:hypothetical protein
MVTLEEQQIRRREIIQELKELNKESRSYLEKIEQNDVTLKAIEGRVKGFFRNGKFKSSLFENYLLELRDITKKDGLYEMPKTAVYDEKTGERLDDTKYAVKNLFVEYAIKWCNKLKYDFDNRKGVDEELGHYQRNIRKGFGQLEGKNIASEDRRRMLELYPHLLYKKKLDIQQVADIWGIDRTNAVRNMKKLTSKESGKVMVESMKGKKKVYSFNPKYTFSGSGGKQKDVKVYVDFLEQVIAKVKEIEKELAIELDVKKLKHSALSTLHAIIPYFHYQTCYAVLNPEDPINEEGETVEEAIKRYTDEENLLPLEFLNIEQITKIVSKKVTDFNYIKRDLYILEQAGAIIYTSNTILVNPKLMWSMDDDLNNENNPIVRNVLYLFVAERTARTQQKNKKKKEMVKKKSSVKTRIEE